MTAIRGTYRDGKITPDGPTDWPEGTRVLIEPTESEPIGIPEEEQGDDPESIARWLAWYDSLEPMTLTPEDEERIRQARAAQKAYDLTTCRDRSEKLRKMWE